MLAKPRESLAAADRLQRRVPWLAFPVAVWKKFGDDGAGDFAALIAYYGFVSIFPILLVTLTVLDLVLHNHPALREHLIDSALSTYPVIGSQLKSVHPLSGTGLALVIGLVVALLGARGVAAAVRRAFDSVWAVPKSRRPVFPWSVLRGIGFVVVVGIGQIVTGYLSSIASGVGHLVAGFGATTAIIVASFVLNIGFFWLAFRLAAANEVSWRQLRVGAVLSAACWQVLQLVGGYVVGHMLQHGSALYGTFGVVLGLLAWLYLQAQVTLYAVEICTVRAWRLWPRGLGKPPTEQDTLARQRYQQRDAQR